jgi:mannose-6-phosphate isomerase-like protein (cupin superfamily)
MKITPFLIATAGILVAQPGEIVLAPKPPKPPAYTAPHKPHTKLAGLKQKNAGKSGWRELVVDDDYLRAEYISLAEGGRTLRAFHPDTRAWWVVLDGEIRFDIEGQPPFVAKKGYIVQAPMQTMFTMETVGDKPSLRLEVNIAGAKTLYPRDVEPPKLPGFDFIPVRFPRRPGPWDRGNKVYRTFEELAENNEKRGAPMTQRVVEDDRGVANFIYGYESKLPPLNPNDKGHYHPECAEFWLIMAGQIRYPIEGQGVIIAEEGDLVYVPKFTFHAPRFHGAGASCRLAMNGYPNITHLYEAPRK